MTQTDLFGFEDMRPKLILKKIITKERMEEVRKLMDKGDDRSAAERLSDLNEALEKLEKRIKHGHKR
jgi:uncharacterized membrane protein (DUF106 family)